MNRSPLRFVALSLAWTLLLPASVSAKDEEQPPPPLQLGGFETQGSGDFGYRFTTIKGSGPKYLELFDLQKGPRLMDFSLFGRAQEGANLFANDYSLTMSGLGGDPFPAAQLTVRKNRLYDLRVNWRQSYYYWDRNDAAALPNGLQGLTTNHDWATVRKFGSTNFLLHATNNLRFTFEYYRNSREGVNFSTRTLDFVGAPDSFLPFKVSNSYFLQVPLNEVASRFAGGVDYAWHNWNFHYRVGYQTSEELFRGTTVNSPEPSINVDDPATANELVNNISWSGFRRLKTPVSEFSYNGKLSPKVEIRGGYIFYRYRGPAALNEAFDGTARTDFSATQFAPFAIAAQTHTQLTEPNHVIDQGFTVTVKDWWRVLVDYRYTRTMLDSLGVFHTLANATTPADETDQFNWRIGLHQFDASMEFTPTPSLVLRPGFRYFKNDVEVVEGGELDTNQSRRSKITSPILSVYYQPSKILSIRGDFDSNNNGFPYTRITSKTDVGSRLQLRFHPNEKFSLEDNFVVRNRRFMANQLTGCSSCQSSDYLSNYRVNSFVATYAPNDRFSIFAGFSYESLFATNTVTFIRGRLPLDVVWRDQTIDRVWQGGLSTKATRRLGFSFAGNYLRTTGAGQITGEPAYYGPVRWPYGTGSVYYDFPKLGRLSIDLQRTYYIEQIVTGDNFSANMLAIRWTRNF